MRVGGRFQEEEIYVLWLILRCCMQKPTQCVKRIILQLKIEFVKNLKVGDMFTMGDRENLILKEEIVFRPVTAD